MTVFWLELHCENAPNAAKGCPSITHEYPMGGTEAPGRYSLTLKAKARQQGWEHIPDIGFCCKACVTKWKTEGL